MSKRKQSSDICESSADKRPNHASFPNDFDWDNFCFICFKPQDKKGNKLSKVVKRDVIKKVCEVAKVKGDVEVETLTKFGQNLKELNAHYHKNCYAKYLPKSTPNSLNSPTLREFEIKRSVEFVINQWKNKLQNGEILSLANFCNEVEIVHAKSTNDEKKMNRSYVKSILMTVAKDDLVLYSHPGKTDIICHKDFPVALLLHELLNFRENEKQEECREISVIDDRRNENIILHDAIKILRTNILSLSRPEYYFTPNDVSLDSSKTFVPEMIRNFILWLIDHDSFVNAKNSNDSNVDDDLLRKCVTISECIIYCATKGKKKISTPFHQGLALQLHYTFGSKMLIEILHSHGFCIHYDELRRILTAIAESEIEKSATVYVPSGVISRNNGGLMIQEGDDNIDVNAETIDGKNSYHVMGRVIFQNQSSHHQIDFDKIEKKSSDKTLVNNNKLFHTIAFTQPTERPLPTKFKNAMTFLQLKLKVSEQNSIFCSDLTWVLLRSLSRNTTFIARPSDFSSHQTIPNWTAFNTRCATKIDNNYTAVQYLPAIDAKPSDPSTVYTTLIKGKELAKACGQDYHIHTFDQQLYAVAQAVKFTADKELQSCVIRLGGFHLLCTYISCINKIWGDSGLQDMLSESELYARNTVEHMLDGKQFHRAIRGLTLCYEALMQLELEAFFDWMLLYKRQTVIDLTKYINFEIIYNENQSTESSFHTLDEETKNVLLPFFNEFKESKKKDPTFKFWDDFLVAVQILLRYVRAERECDWENHLLMTVAMIPYFFACDKPNYSRWGSLYVLEMYLSLPLEVQNEFKKGEFAIRFTPHEFRGMWSDIAVERSVVRDSKGNSGIIGLTRKDSALLRWSVTRNRLGQFASAMSKRSGKFYDCDLYIHEGEGSSSLNRDEEDARKLIDHITSQMSNPFSDNASTDVIINISSGHIGTPEITKSLLEVTKVGQKKMLEFISSTLVENSSASTNFYQPIKQTKLQTFSSFKKSTTLKINGKTVKKIISPETVYQRALSVSAMRNEVNLETILSLPLIDVPIALYKTDGCKRFTNKSELMHVLELEVKDEILTKLPESASIIIIDGMAQLHDFNCKSFKNFNGVGAKLREIIISKMKFFNEIHIVFDRYDDDRPNPKQEKRTRRYGRGAEKSIEIKGERQLKDLKKILSSDKSKCRLTQFLCEYLKENLWQGSLAEEYPNKRVFVAGGLPPREATFEILINKTISCEINYCNHIDADTRLIYQAKQLDNFRLDHQDIIIESPDTDVFLHLNKFKSSRKIWFYTGDKTKLVDNRRYIPIHTLGKELGPNITSSILTLHALSGCDTTSSFFMIGKRKAYSALKKMNEEVLRDFADMTHIPIEKAEQSVSFFLASAYDSSNRSKANRYCVNSLRYNLAMEKNTSVEKLPPSSSELRQHILRSIWQINEWIQATLPNIESFDLNKYGWILQNDELQPNFFEGPTAMEFLQKYFCSCKRKNACSTDICPCVESNFGCCNICTCSDSCSNMEKISDPYVPQIDYSENI
ncbi:hypothetical protein TKK_0017265 [Trichogramma kaykai]